MIRLAKKVGFVGGNHVYHVDELNLLAFAAKNKIDVFGEIFVITFLKPVPQPSLQH
jgi:hypothetical protein